MMPPLVSMPDDLCLDLVAEARRLCLDDVPLDAIAAEVYRLADTAGCVLVDPDAGGPLAGLRGGGVFMTAKLSGTATHREFERYPQTIPAPNAARAAGAESPRMA